MPDADLGRNASLKIGTTASNVAEWNKGVHYGMASHDLSRTIELREVPGGSTGTERQSLGTEDGGLTFVVDANATTTPTIFGREGLPLYYEWMPGTGTGTALWKGKMLIESIAMPVDSKGVITYSVANKIDGKITKTTGDNS